MIGDDGRLPPLWSDSGHPVNLQAAAADAFEWLAVLDRLVTAGEVQLGANGTRAQLRGCKSALKRFVQLEGELPNAT